MKTLYLVMFIGTIIAGCAMTPAKNTKFFDNPVCEPPCWQNVTPGVTTKEDAIKIFAKFADKQGVLDLPNQDPYYEDDIRFGPPNGGTVFVDTLNGKVSVMYFEGAFGGPLTLRHAIELFGEPQSVLVVQGGLYDVIRFYDPSKGIAFGWLITGNTPSVASGDAEINPNSFVGQIWFFDPRQNEHFMSDQYGSLESVVKKSLHPWIGYGKINGKYWPSITPLL